MKYKIMREEELKNKVGNDWFDDYDTTEILGNIDFSVLPKQNNIFGRIPLLWAEAKTGDFDIPTMFVQLILTIGKARTFEKTLPPAFLGAFDFKKIDFVPYLSIQDIFYINDFNWNVTPSNHDSKEFKIIKERIEKTLTQRTYIFDYQKDEKDLRVFIKKNVSQSTEVNKIKINKNNFIPIYLRWLEIIKPIIDVNWDNLKDANILDNDFYLADIFVDDKSTQKIDDDSTTRDSLFVIFQNQGYKIAKENINQMFDATINIRNKDVYQQFWKRYKRPPQSEFQEYIIERRDLLVPQDIRERKGAYFTPRPWVNLSQNYITNFLGEDWQDDYFIWDCAAGTGNLLAGLTNKYNVYASTLDQADVNVMQERIEQGANLLKSHVFQFDFLNDDFNNLPEGLKTIINDPHKRSKLIIYINPPYAEADNRKGEGRKEVAISAIRTKYSKQMGYSKRELYIQFLTRIYFEIDGCFIAEFSKLKNIQSPSFKPFREFFLANLEAMFIVPAKSFDNVKGTFPIGFKIWNTSIKNNIESIVADIYDEKGEFLGQKSIWTYDNNKLINDWVKTFRYTDSKSIATIIGVGSDFQNQRLVRFGKPHMKVPASNHNWQISMDNLIESSIYYAVRKVIPATWHNDREQFLFPADSWKEDIAFQGDCLTFTLFDNGFTSTFGTNNWIPFIESEVDAKEKFESNFITDFIRGKTNRCRNKSDLFSSISSYNKPLLFSSEAQDVFDSGRNLWKYYHQKSDTNVNGSLYDIREYFQGRNDKGKMNNSSSDKNYMFLIKDLRDKLKFLTKTIEPKLYKHEFLKK